MRDAGNVDASGAVVIAGAKYEVRNLGEMCSLCGVDGCGACSGAGATCIFTPLDLGIALGSAVALVSDNRVDSILACVGRNPVGACDDLANLIRKVKYLTEREKRK